MDVGIEVLFTVVVDQHDQARIGKEDERSASDSMAGVGRLHK